MYVAPHLTKKIFYVYHGLPNTNIFVFDKHYHFKQSKAVHYMSYVIEFLSVNFIKAFR